MTDAIQSKAIINIKQGTVELEGPQEFVEKYLDRCIHLLEKQKLARGHIKIRTPGGAK